MKGEKDRDWFFANLDGSNGDEDDVRDDKKDEWIDLLFDLPQ